MDRVAPFLTHTVVYLMVSYRMAARHYVESLRRRRHLFISLPGMRLFVKFNNMAIIAYLIFRLTAERGLSPGLCY